MAANTRKRPGETGYDDRRKDSDRRGKHPCHGPAGKISRAWTTAPDDATPDVVQAVGFRAWRDDRDPAEVWNDVLSSEPGRRQEGDHD